MEKTIKVNLLDLPDTEKIRVLKRARTYLKEQVTEERYCQTVFLQNVKHAGMRERISSLLSRN